MVRRLIHPLAMVIPMLALASCGGSSSGEPALPTPKPISPDGAQYLRQTYSPDGKRISYWRPAADSTSQELWVANADLSSPKKLPVTQAVWFGPAIWSPDGTMLAASASEFGVATVVIVPVDGGSPRRVAQGANVTIPVGWFKNGEGLSYFGLSEGGRVQSFAYSVPSGSSRELAPGEKRSTLGTTSPDGSHVAYFTLEGSKSLIWVADGDGKNPRQLTTEGFEQLEEFHEWSPDGKELLYESRRTGHADLWILPIDGGPARQLTRDIREDSDGVWSPDGKWIAFLSNRGKQSDVWIVPSAGGPELRVTDSAVSKTGLVSWLPGTPTLSFGIRSSKTSVWALDVASGKERRLTDDIERLNRFTPSRDGTQILLAVGKGGGVQELQVMPIAGGTARTLFAGEGSVDVPVWSPDGKQIAFASDRGGSQDIWVVDVAGGPARQLTSWPGAEFSATWSHDGSAIYFVADKDSNLGDVWRVSPAGGEPTRVTHTGNIGDVAAFERAPGFMAQILGLKSGQMALSRFRPDGTANVVWEKSTALWESASPTGDAVIAEVEQPDGKLRTMLLKTDGSGGRILLPPGQMGQGWSRDGKWLSYTIVAGGANDLGLLNLSDGTTRRLTTTPESEEGAEFTADGKTLIFRRVAAVQRITTVDISKLIAGKK